MKKEDVKYFTKELRPGHVQVDFNVNALQNKKAYQKALDEAKKAVDLKGFRKGKVPNSVLQKKYGEKLQSIAHESVINQAVGVALSTPELRPFSQHVVTDTGTFSKNKNLTFSITFDLYPEFTVPAIDSCTIEHVAIEVTDDQVKEHLEAFRQRVAQLEVTEDPAGPKSWLQVKVETENFETESDAVKQLLNCATTWINLETPTMYPGADVALVGAVKDAVIETPIAFGDDFSQQELAGTTLKIKFTVLEVRTHVVPGLDDSLAKKCGMKTFVELSAAARKEIATNLHNARKTKLREVVAEQLLANFEIQLPPISVEKEIANQIQIITDKKIAEKPMAKSVKEVITEAAEVSGTKELTAEEKAEKQEIEDEATLRVVEQMRRGFLLQRLSEQEELDATQEELMGRIQTLAQRYRITPEQLVEKVDARFYSDVRQDIVFNKVLDTAIAKATINDPLGLLTQVTPEPSEFKQEFTDTDADVTGEVEENATASAPIHEDDAPVEAVEVDPSALAETTDVKVETAEA